MITTSNFAYGTTAVTLAGARYLKKMQEVFDRVRETGESDFNTVLATTYLKGLYDMSHLCIMAADGKRVADELARIDANVMAYENGQYEEREDGDAEDLREP